MKNILIKLFVITALILSVTSYTFASQKIENHFSIFNKSYLPTWSDHDNEDHDRHYDDSKYDNDSDHSYDHGWYDDDSDDSDDHDWYDDDSDDDSDHTVGGPVAPEPVSSLLFVIGGATLGFKRFIKRRKL